MNDQKITSNYIFAGILAVIFTWIVHEFAHWLTSELYGFDTIMRLNGTWPVDDEIQSDLMQNVISASGPIITFAQGLLAFVLLNRYHWNKFIYLFLFTSLYMRFLAGLMNFINLNDEGRISEFLGIGTFTLPIIVSGLLFLMVYKISKKNQLVPRFQAWTILIVMVSSSILILSDQYMKIRIL